ncbi:MAG: hypothetical protein ABEJ03_01745 [Candidatus Nanohaloarchaea archaeon]
MKRVFLAATIVFLSAPGAAELDSEIRKTCQNGYEPLVSMPAPNETYSNIGEPDLYEYKVCVDGISSSSIGVTCNGNVGFYMSSRSTDAHFSGVQGYNLKVCTGNAVTEIKDSCSDDQTPLFRVSDRINGFGRHVAGLSGEVYDSVVCATKSTPSTVELTMSYDTSSVDSTYLDDRKVSDTQYSSLAEFPYIVNEDGSTVSGIVAPSFRSATRSSGSGEVNISLERRADSSGFMVPLTREDHEDIEDDQEAVLSRTFLSSQDPNFAGFPAGEPELRTFLKPDVDLESNLSISSGSYSLKLEKTGENEVTITAE